MVNDLIKFENFRFWLKLIKQNMKNSERRNIFGVLPYIAPEVLVNKEYTKAADIYSFGIIVDEVVTGFAP